MRDVRFSYLAPGWPKPAKAVSAKAVINMVFIFVLAPVLSEESVAANKLGLPSESSVYVAIPEVSTNLNISTELHYNPNSLSGIETRLNFTNNLANVTGLSFNSLNVHNIGELEVNGIHTLTAEGELSAEAIQGSAAQASASPTGSEIVSTTAARLSPTELLRKTLLAIKRFFAR